MVGKAEYSSVPTSADLENNFNQKKYTVNKSTNKGLYISKVLCGLLVLGALLLALAAALAVYFLVPAKECGASGTPEALKEAVGVEGSRAEVEERLPRSIEPTHYRLQLIPFIENRTTNGVVDITLVPKEDTSTIIFHANELKISENSLKIISTRPNAVPIDVVGQEYLSGERYKVTIRQVLQKGQQYILSIKFEGILNNHLQGFYRSQYSDLNGRTRYAASTQFSPTDARRAFPCFDEPSFKAKFTISLARPHNFTTLSNMPLERYDPFVGEKDWYWDHYPETPKMSTYLVAFVYSDLKYGVQKDRLIKIWSQETFLTQTDYASTIAPRILRYFENYFNTSFPLPKIDIVAVPEFGFSAMENWGLITFRESSLLFDPLSSTNEDMRTIATVLSHEIAHQWFGNLVTPKWWNDLWLKEGFATYLQYMGVDHAEPSWKITQEFMISEIARAMSIDSLASSRPISFEVTNTKQIKQAFDEISYSKGACIIRMMNHFLGQDTFKRGLVNFLKKHAYGNADREDLFSILTYEAQKYNVLMENETVQQIMDTWTEQPGFPVVTAIADYKTSTLRIRQKRFLLTDDEDEKSKWWIPISFVTDANPYFEDTLPKFWMRGESEIIENVEFGQRWYLLNINQTGYYIVNYDEQNWRSLSNNIMNIPPLIRAQLISDAMDLARANQLDYEIPLRMISTMAVNDHDVMFIPTYVALEKLRFLSDIMATTPAYGLLEEYTNAIFESTFYLVQENGEEPTDDYLTKRIRRVVLEWPCKNSNSKCTHNARSMYRNWMAEGRLVPPNLREIVYCTAIREEEGLHEWDFAYQKYTETRSPSEKLILLDALGCIKKRWLLSRYLDNLIDANSSISIQDADRVFESVARNPVGTDIAFNFLRSNWYNLLDHYGDGFNILAKMIKSVAPYMNTEFQLNELVNFKNSVKSNLSTTASAFDSAIERVKSNVQWMKKNYNQIADWLNKYRGHYRY